MEKFPDLDVGGLPRNAASPIMKLNGHANGNGNGDHWLPRSESNGQARGVRWGATPNGINMGRGHDRQKSIGDALRTIRARHGSVSQNAHEIADALRAPVSPKLSVRPFFPSPKPNVELPVQCADPMLRYTDSVPVVVHFVCPYKHLLQVHLDSF